MCSQSIRAAPVVGMNRRNLPRRARYREQSARSATRPRSRWSGRDRYPMPRPDGSAAPRPVDNVPRRDQASTIKPVENAALPRSPMRNQATAKPSTDDLLSKPFRDEGSPSGENLKFDFNDDRMERETPAPDEIAHARDSGEWQVGESDEETADGETMASRAQAFASSDTRTEEPGPESKVRRRAARPETREARRRRGISSMRMRRQSTIEA